MEPVGKAPVALSDGWSVVPVETVDQLRAENLIDVDEPEVDAFAAGHGFHYWSLRDEEGAGHATLTAPAAPTDGVPFKVIAVWFEDGSDYGQIARHFREWFDLLRADGQPPLWVAGDAHWKEVETTRELLALYDDFVLEPFGFLGGFDPEWGIEREHDALPEFGWEPLSKSVLSDLRSPYWPPRVDSAETCGRAFFSMLLLTGHGHPDEVIRRAREKVELAFEERREKLVIEQLWDEEGEAAFEKDLSVHPRAIALREELEDWCRREFGFVQPYAFVQYLEDLLKVGPTRSESLLEPLPTPCDARRLVEDMGRAET